MRGLSQIRLGRSIQTRAKRARMRKRKPRFAGKLLKSAFRAKPVVPRPTQPYLSTDANIAELLKIRHAM
jgi:hypothetical protein